MILIDQIIKDSDIPPIIIIQGDHGPDLFMPNDSWPKAKNLTKTMLNEKTGILNAYYLPQCDGEYLYESISPVNSFRAIFNSCFDMEFNLLDDYYYYTGKYTRIDGSIVSGPSIASLIEDKQSRLNQEMMNKFHKTLFAMTQMKKTAESGKSYDQMLGEGDKAGNKVVQDVVDSLKDQTRTIEKLITALNLQSIEFEGSDSLDSPEKVFQ